MNKLNKKEVVTLKKIIAKRPRGLFNKIKRNVAASKIANVWRRRKNNPGYVERKLSAIRRHNNRLLAVALSTGKFQGRVFTAAQRRAARLQVCRANKNGWSLGNRIPLLYSMRRMADSNYWNIVNSNK